MELAIASLMVKGYCHDIQTYSRQANYTHVVHFLVVTKVMHACIDFEHAHATTECTQRSFLVWHAFIAQDRNVFLPQAVLAPCVLTE